MTLSRPQPDGTGRVRTSCAVFKPLWRIPTWTEDCSSFAVETCEKVRLAASVLDKNK